MRVEAVRVDLTPGLHLVLERGELDPVGVSEPAGGTEVLSPHSISPSD